MSTTGFTPSQNGTLIGLGGKLRAGKDAVGEYLRDEHNFVVMGMSDALNEALLKLNPIIPTGKYWEAGYEHYMTYQDYHAAHGYVEAKKNPEVRRLLQVLGTEVGREMIDPEVWVRMAEKKIREHWANGKSVVITAMRFPNEIDMLKRLGGLSVWVERPDSDRGAPEGLQGHASENSVSQEDFQYVILNDGTLEQLYRKVEKHIVQREGVEAYASGGILPGVSTSEKILVNSHCAIRPEWDNIYPPYDR